MNRFKQVFTPLGSRSASPSPTKGSSQFNSNSVNSSTSSVSTGAKSEKKRLQEQARAERAERLKHAREQVREKHREAYENDPFKANYGVIEPGDPLAVEGTHFECLEEMCSKHCSESVIFRARIHHVRPLSSKVAFIVFRQQLATIQGVLVVRDNLVSENFVRWAERLSTESVVIVHGKLQTPQGDQKEIKSTTFHQIEVLIEKLYVVGTVTMTLPFHVQDVQQPRPSVEYSQEDQLGNEEGMKTLDPNGSLKNVIQQAFESHHHNQQTKKKLAAHIPPHIRTDDLSPAASPIQTPVSNDFSSSTITDSSNVTPTSTSNVTPETRTSTASTPPELSSRGSIKRHHHVHQVQVKDNTRQANRVLDLRSKTSQAIFRIEAGVTRFFRGYLDNKDFMEIHSSKLEGGATESGASVFTVDYFGRKAFLAQSPQLGKQMAIAADLERVYEIGPVFRAENSNTHRHLTEFTGLDIEMAIDRDYHEVIDVLDGALLSIFKGLQEKFRKELDVVREMFPSEDLVFPDKTIRITFKEGVKMLNDAGWTEDGKPISEFEDFSTPTEKKLGALVKEKFNTDYYILDKFPASARPFYTMPDSEDPRFSNSCDFFVRGEEILSGGQRIHQAPLLEKRMKESNVDPEVLKAYVDGFRQGCPPHGGGGIGLQRLVMLFLDLGNIRRATLYPRDPRSFPDSPEKNSISASNSTNSVADAWLGPVADTLAYAEERRKGNNPKLPLLEDLIAGYGDSSNTSWLDPFWTVWRDNTTGAAVGYAVHKHYSIAWGRPLCDDKQLEHVIKAYVSYMKHQKLKPIWACVDDKTEETLRRLYSWRCVAAVAEQRVQPSNLDAEAEKKLQNKVRRAEKEGVKVTAIEGTLSEELKEEIRKRLHDWQEDRKGTQVYSAGLRPFDDPTHRHYFIARDAQGQLCGLVVLAQLSKDHGYQVKYSLDFPGCPKGTIEYIIWTALRAAGKAGVGNATFGGAAPDQIIPSNDKWDMHTKLLSKIYNSVNATFRLTDKAEFRRKFGTEADAQWVCFPKHGFGLRGVESLMKILQADKNKNI